MRALVIRPDFTNEVIDIDPANSLATLQSLVGGWIEAIDAPDASIFINEEGKLVAEPHYNEVATALWHRLNPQSTDWIAGTAVVLGPVDDQGDTTPLTDGVLAVFQAGVR